MSGADAQKYLTIASDAMWAEIGKRVDAATVTELRKLLQGN